MTYVSIILVLCLLSFSATISRYRFSIFVARVPVNGSFLYGSVRYLTVFSNFECIERCMGHTQCNAAVLYKGTAEALLCELLLPRDWKNTTMNPQSHENLAQNHVIWIRQYQMDSAAENEAASQMTTVAMATCPPPFTQTPHGCYHLETVDETWVDARDSCSSYGPSVGLATPDSPDVRILGRSR